MNNRIQEWIDPGKKSVHRSTRTWKEPTNQERLETIQRQIEKIMNGKAPINETTNELLDHLRLREKTLIWEIEKGTK